MGYLRDLLIGAAGSLIAAEAYVHAHPLARWIVERAIARLPAEERERWREAWLADLNEMIGVIEKLFWALGCYWAATVTNVSAWRTAHDVYIYECQDHTVKLELTKFDHAGASGTITLDGHVFYDVRMVEGGRYSFRGVDRAGTTAELRTATKGYGMLDIKPAKGKPLHFELDLRC
jgi:hypothetical protein